MIYLQCVFVCVCANGQEIFITETVETESKDEQIPNPFPCYLFRESPDTPVAFSQVHNIITVIILKLTTCSIGKML